MAEKKVILSGDEALAEGVFAAGVRLGTGYPGTPSTEILEHLSEIGGRAQWAPNEKVAMEVAIGVAFGGGSAAVALKVMKPKSYNEGPEIADYLASGSTVLLNIENMDKVSTKRLIDFLLGATHVLGGTMNMVTNTTFVFAPKSVGVADLTANDEIEEATEDAYSEE